MLFAAERQAPRRAAWRALAYFGAIRAYNREGETDSGSVYLSMSAPGGRLDSWKEIAAYLRRGARTVQRWESEEGLPVHRLQHEKLGSVYAFQSELDAWWESRRARLENAPPAAVQDAPSVAVLPFADLTREKDQSYFCEGVADEILAALARISGLKVASRGASFRFRSGVDDPRETARRLRVCRLLEGSVRRDDAPAHLRSPHRRRHRISGLGGAV